jgi:type 1 glutamine amidotransferase
MGERIFDPAAGSSYTSGMKSLPLSALSLFLFSCLAPSAVPAAETPNGHKPLRALMITGGCCHDYMAQKNILAEGISARAHVEWTIVHDPSTKTTGRPEVYHKENWAEGFDVVVHNECFADEKELPWLERVVQPHRDGVSAVVIHCAMHCYRAPTNEWFRFVGVRSHRHGSHFAYYLNNLQPQHPVMKGFPPAWIVPLEELYNIAEVMPGTTPLAAGWSHETKKFEPNIWVGTFGRARVFGTTIGHYNRTMENPLFLDLVTRGLLWACGRLGDDGQPLPGYETRLARAPSPAGPAWSVSQKFPESETPMPLFNGNDLKGWEGQMKYWSVKDGVIIGRNTAETAPKASTYLTTRKKYRHFRLIFEGKLVTSEMHSGIALLGESVEKEGDSFSYQGHLVMFPSDWGFWDLYRRNSIYRDDGRARAAGRQHDWNRMEILALGNRIRVAVNGKLVADWTDPQPELCQAGPIGLQLHSNTVPQEVHFRGLVVSENPEARLLTIDK